MHERDVELFNDSIERCSCKPDFLRRFYTLFLASSDTVAKKFEHADLRKQARLLKTSLYIMMLASGACTNARRAGATTVPRDAGADAA
jgi:hypothetical protein